MFDALRFEISPVIASISTILILLAIVVLIGLALLKSRSEKVQTKGKK
jgi:ABC-type spermidine/putrescine transport system permease subunit II